MATTRPGADLYRHKPLADPRTQIRLLSLEWDSPHDYVQSDSNLKCTVSTWNLHSSPPFRAISYAWGDEEDQQRIAVDERPMFVRHNCHYALWQAWSHWPEDYFWIDSLCIDQSDLSEKASQVAIMTEIFSAASQVCACVGPHDGTSVLLMNYLTQCADFEKTMPSVDRDAVLASLNHKDAAIALHHIRSVDEPEDMPLVIWLWSLGGIRIREFDLALHDFAERNYWSRLWIIQELKSASGRIQILCGSHIVDWRRTVDLLDLFQGIWFSNAQLHGEDDDAEPHWDRPCLMSDVADIIRRAGVKFSWTDSNLRRFKCSDVRDIVYGTLTLFDWTMGGPALVPDYKLSKFDLALSLISHIPNTRSDTITSSFGVAHSILWVLSIARTGPEFGVWLAAKRSSTPSSNSAMPNWTETTQYAPALVYMNDSGQLCSKLRGLWQEAADSTAVDVSPGPWYDIQTGSASTIQADAEVFPGDVLIVTHYRALVLRRSTGGNLQVVGRVRPGVRGENIDHGGAITSCKCFPVEKSLRVEIQATHLDTMEMLACSNRLVPGQRELLHMPKIPRTGSSVQDVSTAKIGGKDARIPLLTHLLGCRYMQTGRT